MKKIFFICSVVALALDTVNAQLVVTSSTNPAQVVNSFILSGVTAINVVYTGAANTLGTFSNGNTTNLGLSDGIVMTTGNLNSVPTINSPASNFASSDNIFSGCSELDALIPSYITYDASILEFDLVPVGNILEFQYVFASEEYPEYVCSSYNDVFGFLITGPDPAGGNYTNSNIAVIPGTNLPVAINTINPGISGTSGTYNGCISLAYSSLFINNEAILGQTIVFDGFTTVLTAKTHVIPATTYHLIMAIADAGDRIYDSGIFLKAQSMKSYNSTTGIEEVEIAPLKVFPNPAKNILELSLTQKSEIEIVNVQGQILKSFTSDQNHTSIDISGLAKGIYFVKVKTEKGIDVLKFCKE